MAAAASALHLSATATQANQQPPDAIAARVDVKAPVGAVSEGRREAAKAREEDDELALVVAIFTPSGTVVRVCEICDAKRAPDANCEHLLALTHARTATWKITCNCDNNFGKNRQRPVIGTVIVKNANAFLNPEICQRVVEAIFCKCKWRRDVQVFAGDFQWINSVSTLSFGALERAAEKTRARTAKAKA
jgi:hypothetical protein